MKTRFAYTEVMPADNPVGGGVRPLRHEREGPAHPSRAEQES